MLHIEKIKKKNKKAGMTLAELLIALAILMIVTAPILGVFVMSTRIAAGSHKLTIATFTAQLLIEELVGLTEYELEEKATKINDVIKVYNGFAVNVDINYDIEIVDVPYPNLARVTVKVFDTNASLLCTQENFLNILIGGVLP